MPFDGQTYVRRLDRARLTSALQRVFYVATRNGWHSLAEIHHEIREVFGERYSEAGISARLRDVRKSRFGGHQMESRRRSGGLWEYRITPNLAKTAIMRILYPTSRGAA